MRSHFLAMAILSGIVALGGPAADAGSLAGSAATVPQAPIGHLQPRVRSFSPQSPAEQAEQQQMSNFDVEQQKLDLELDKRLNICRC